jgi:hypothetical protein
MGEGCEAGLRDEWDEGEDDEYVVQVSFAPSFGWFALQESGDAVWNGLPDSLEDHLEKYWDKYDGVKALSVGHNGEWFVRFDNGKVTSRGVHPTLKKLLHDSSSKSRTGAVEWVELGPNGTFVVLFEKYTAWYGGEDLTEDVLSCM